MNDLGINKNSQLMILILILFVFSVLFIFIPMVIEWIMDDIIVRNLCQIFGSILGLYGLYLLIENVKHILKGINIKNDSNEEISVITKEEIKITNITDYRVFVQNLEIDKFDEIILMAHTGKESLNLLKAKLLSMSEIIKGISVKVILKHPYSETTNRLELISNHIVTFINEIKKIDGVTIDVRYYNGLPYFNALLCKYKNSEQYYSYVSNYKWQNHKTKACEIGTMINDNNSELFITAKSWFEHLFSKEKLHTIIFDLDDTIIDSYESQIKSWVFLIRAIFNNNYELGKFKDNLKSGITKQNLRRKIREIFLKTTKTEERWDYLFNNISNDDIKELEEIRFEKRTQLTISEANLFDNCEHTLKELSKTYNLAIISSTSEEIIKRILDKHELNSYFSLYLGKDNEIDKLSKVEDKTPYLIKISNLVGVPFNRILFVGDSQTDYKSSKQLNIKFVSANMIAKRLRMGTFIKEHKGLSFDSYHRNSLINIVEELKGTL